MEDVDRKVVKSLWGARFRGWTFLSSVGRLGGILVMWDDRMVSCLEVVLGSFSMSVKFKGKDDFEWWLTGVYGPNDPHLRFEFWEELFSLHGLCHPNWCLGGDFNVIRLASEKLNGSRVTFSMRSFDDFIRQCNLRDPLLCNASFTWSNMQERLVYTRIDHFLFSFDWEDHFPQLRQEALVRIVSDHYPLALESCPLK